MSGAMGILGGTFDPPHRGHLAMAHVAAEGVGLDRVFLAPAAQPPHKNGEASHRPTALEHRMKMAAIAAGDGEDIDVYCDEPEKGPSFTADLLRRFRARSGAADIYFIVGADSFRDLPTWKNPDQILAQCTLVVFPRDDVPLHTGASGTLSVVVFEGPRVDVSSRDVRARVANGKSIEGMVSDAVARYIVDHDLYRAS